MFILAADEPVVHDEIMADIYLCSYFSILYPALADSGRRGLPDETERCALLHSQNIADDPRTSKAMLGFSGSTMYQVLICITNYCHERAFEEVYLAY